MKLIILGAGGFGRTIADLARQSGRYSSIQFLDDRATGGPILGTCQDFCKFLSPNTEFYPAFGCNELRLTWLDRLEASGAALATLVHSTAYVSPEATLEPGTAVLPGAILNTGTVLRRGCILNCGAIIDHSCVLEEGVHVCLGAIVKAGNRLKRCSKIEAGRVIENGTYPLIETCAE